jgi:hypothetical protein
MNIFIRTWWHRAALSLLALIVFFLIAAYSSFRTEAKGTRLLTNGELHMRLYALPALCAGIVFGLTTLLATNAAKGAPVSATTATAVQTPYMAQVVGLQWLNPLQRRDYPTEWQLLWTMGLAGPNKNDDKVNSNPKKYGELQSIADIAYGLDGTVSFMNYHSRYIEELTNRYRDIYFSDSTYFYNAHSLKDKSTWRELAGIHVEYALPEGKLDPVEAANATRDSIIDNFDIGSKSFPNSWTRSTPPDVRITMGGPNAGFTSLTAGLDYLQTHPAETVWVMKWDAPSRPKDAQINENMVLLVLAGPHYKTERAALAWLGYPASSKVGDFERNDDRSRVSLAWKATLEKAALNAGISKSGIGFVVHDAGNAQPTGSERLGRIARTVTEELPELDFTKETFNTPAVLGDMGAGTALTNVALGIAYANHFGKSVLVAGTTDQDRPTATVVLPPAVARPIAPDAPWFRARGRNQTYLPWWGLRHDAPAYPQGFSE